MKKSLIICAAAFFLLAISLTSCFSDSEETYTFRAVYSTNVNDTTLMAPAKNFLLTYPYFTVEHSYYDYYVNAVNSAYNDFANACNNVDGVQLCSLIPAQGDDGDVGMMIVYLLSNDTGEVVAYSQAWTSSQGQ